MKSIKELRYGLSIDNNKWEVRLQEKFDKSLLLFITGKCNLNCLNCFSLSSRGQAEMTVSQIEKIIKANPSFSRIDLMGGEPLMHSSILEIITLLNRYEKRTSVYTNGLYLHRIIGHLPIRVCISFHEIQSESACRKPLLPIKNNLDLFASNSCNKIKLILLVDKYNVDRIMQCINYVDKELPYIKTLTIGLMRNENDYWNDNLEGVLPFVDYYYLVQYIIDGYSGRLNLDIFTKGVLTISNLDDNKYYLNRTNRFKCIFQDMTYSDCLYNACDSQHLLLPTSLQLPISQSSCKHTGRNECLADKIRLYRKSED